MAEKMSKEDIQKENQKMKDSKVCMICKDKARNKMFLPCAHLTTCELCWLACRQCPQCRSKIRSVVHVYKWTDDDVIRDQYGKFGNIWI